MKCSMMFKCFVLLAVLLCLRPAAFAQEPFLPDGSGDVLLVHADNPGSEAQQQIETLVTMSTALGKVMDYGTADVCREALADYDYIILYDAEEIDASFGAALRKSGAAVMIFGSSTLERYLTLTGRAEEVLEAEPQKNGTLRYSFPTGATYECITHWQGLFRVAASGYESGSIQAGTESYPFCAQVAEVRFIPVTDLSRTLVRAAVMQEITQWMWPYQDNPREYAQFLVLDSVYPFLPADRLLDIIDQVEEISVPYVISVMPLRANTDYPAMTQFCQVLAYAQSRGATVILHAPILHQAVETPEELYEMLTDMTVPLMEHGVYPVGIEVPLSWLNQEPYLTALGRYKTVFVYDDGQESGFRLDAHTSAAARKGFQLVFPKMDLDESGISQLDCYAAATYADCGSDAALFLRYAAQGRSGSNPFEDLRDYNHVVWLNDRSLTYQKRAVYVDGKRVDTSFQPVPYDTNYDFQRSPLDRITVDLQNQNRVLMAAVVVLVTIFAASIAYARHRMRRRFFIDKTKEEQKK